MSTDLMSAPTGTSTASDEISDHRGNNDVELRELVYQSLEREGLISHFKAQLRAAVFKTIEKSVQSNNITSHTTIDEGITGRICRALVLDWLQHSHLLYTEDVFKVETSGSAPSLPLSQAELLEQLQMSSNQIQSQPILHALLRQTSNRSVSAITSLPDYIRQSIDDRFPTEKINDLNILRDHFRSLFSSAFDSTVLDTFIVKCLPATTKSVSKHEYESICLRWMQACANVLKPPSSHTQHTSSINPTSLLTVRNTSNNDPKKTTTVRAVSPTDSSSSSSSASSENRLKKAFDFQLPTTLTSTKSVSNKLMDSIPLPSVNLDDDDSNEEENEEDEEEEEEEETSASVFSKRNATPNALDRLKNIDIIIQGNETPRSRTVLKKQLNNGTRELPVEYDDESISQSVSHSMVSSVDDVTVDKASPIPTAYIDFLEEL